MKKIHSAYTIVTLIIFLVFTSFWVSNHLVAPPGSAPHEAFAATYGIMALWGGILGLYVSYSWGGIKSILGRAIFMFSVGLLLQEFGQLSYSFYIYFLHVEVPYPSIGDIGYFGSIPAYIYGIVLLGRASGAHLSLRSYSGRFQAVFLPVLLLVVSYSIFLRNYEFSETPLLTVLLDFGYPLGQAIYVSLAFLVFSLSRTMLGGLMRQPLSIILLALFAQYLADYTFLYQSIHETWIVGGINDYIYLFSYTLMTLGLLSVYKTLGKMRSTTTS